MWAHAGKLSGETNQSCYSLLQGQVNRGQMLASVPSSHFLNEQLPTSYILVTTAQAIQAMSIEEQWYK